jgi:tetratricopeptide (TPR) repeat protein
MRVSRVRYPVSGLFLMLAACASPRPSTVDPTIAQFSSSARSAYERGALPQAVRFYELALARARTMDDSEDIGRAAHNLAACYLLLDRPADALARAGEAELELARGGMPVTEVLLLKAKAQIALGRTNEAQAALDAALAMKISPTVRADALLLKGAMACESGDLNGAGALLIQAQEAARQSGSPSVIAGTHRLSGRMAEMGALWNSAAADYDAETLLRRQAGQHREMAEALGRAGMTYEKAGQPALAAERFYRAGRGLYAQGDAVGALKLIEQGLKNSADAPEMKARLTALFEEIRRAVAGATAETKR